MGSVAVDPRVVLVPGGFTGAWMWAEVAALLEREGIEAIPVELPTIGEESAGADFYADARAVRELLDGLETPVLLCGHSYGGESGRGERRRLLAGFHGCQQDERAAFGEEEVRALRNALSFG